MKSINLGGLKTALELFSDALSEQFSVQSCNTIGTFTGATSIVSGSSGLVPAPTTSDTTKFLCGDGSWQTVSGGGIDSLPVASSNTLGCVKIGAGLAISNGVLSVSLSELILPSSSSNSERAVWLA